MKIKGIIKNLNSKKFKNDNSQNISRNLSGAVVGDVGSVQIVPPSSLCLLSIGPLQCLLSANYRVLIWCSCHFQSGSLFFILASSVCKSLQCLISALTQEAKVVTYLSLLVQLCCGKGGTLPTNITGVYGECLQCMHHWVCPCSRQCVPSRSTLLRLQGDPDKDLNDLDNHDGVITHLESDILECEVRWALRSITMNKASGGDGIPLELFQTLKDDAVKVLHSICQQMWKTQQWPQDWKRSVLIPIPKKGMPKNIQTTALISHARKVMLKILQVWL